MGVGGILNYTEPVICHPSQKKCYWASNGRLTRNDKMGLDNRLLSSAAVNINRKDLFISGGYSFQGLLDSTEVHTIENAPKLGPNLPFATSDHCMVQFKSTRFMLIGFDRNLRKNRYFIYDLST